MQTLLELIVTWEPWLSLLGDLGVILTPSTKPDSQGENVLQTV